MNNTFNRKTIIIFILVFSIHNSKFKFQTDNNSLAYNKKGGICFRVDDNKYIGYYLEFNEIFKKYNFNFSFALNLGLVLYQGYIDGVKILQNNGHELMDHTPDHKTNWFLTRFDPNQYLNLEGVDHISTFNKICLRHNDVNITECKQSGIADIQNNYIISKKNGAFKNLKTDEIYVYLQKIDTLVWISELKNLDPSNPDTIRFKDVWHEAFDIGTLSNESYYIFNYDDIHISSAGLKVLAKESIKLAKEYGFNRSRTWIQPGGYFPHLHRHDLRESIGTTDTLGYLAGAVYPEASIKTYNEYDPFDDKKFGMQWGDFCDDTWKLSRIKAEIADKIAKHRVLIGHSHFSNLLDGWDGYLNRVDDLLLWCSDNGIPVLTYSEWAGNLYDVKPDPYTNIIPPLNIDLDQNNTPDGYSNDVANYTGTIDKTDGSPNSNDYCFKIDHKGGICKILGLGGIEKGKNQFELWTKGVPGNRVTVEFAFENEIQLFEFPADTEEWTKYNLSQSINENHVLTIPESVSLLDISINCSNYFVGITKVSGMCLTKIKPNLILELDLLLQGSYNQNNQQRTELSKIPLLQPYNCEPWNYNGEESVISIPNNVLDWVLVELRSEISSESVIRQKVGFLMENGSVKDLDGYNALEFKEVLTDSFFIVVYHRNHLPIMSAEKVFFIYE